MACSGAPQKIVNITINTKAAEMGVVWFCYMWRRNSKGSR